MNIFFLDRSARRRKETLATEGTQEHKNISKDRIARALLACYQRDARTDEQIIF